MHFYFKFTVTTAANTSIMPFSTMGSWSYAYSTANGGRRAPLSDLANPSSRPMYVGPYSSSSPNSFCVCWGAAVGSLSQNYLYAGTYELEIYYIPGSGS